MDCIAKTALAILAASLCASHGCDGDDPVRSYRPDPEPMVRITRPEPSAGIPRYPEVVRFAWTSSGERPAEKVRWMATRSNDTSGSYDPTFDLPGDLESNPSRYDTLWSDWIEYAAPADSGTTTLIGDDEDLPKGRRIYFILQAMDREGNVTESFERGLNVRDFIMADNTGPILHVYEPLLAGFTFLGTSFEPQARRIPPGIPLRFAFEASAEDYLSEVTGYRIGWDVTDHDAWSEPFSEVPPRAGEVVLHSGVHTLTIEAIDLSGNITRARIRIEIIEWPMDRVLLRVDDYAGAPVQPPDLSAPGEAEHDEFWNGICARVPGFDPSGDEYDCAERAGPPPVDLIGRYGNIIWNFAPGTLGSWEKVIGFVPESGIGAVKNRTTNTISIFLRKGGHIWTTGKSDQGGGLAAALPPSARYFPLSLECEVAGPDASCADRSGTRSMPFEDYCITVLDKVAGRLRGDADLSFRVMEHHDVVTGAFRDGSDPWTAARPDLPARLDLRDEVKARGSFFCTDSTCSPGGFTYVEAYDPAYWMGRTGQTSRPCFHPIYRLETASDESALYGQAAALWSTRYADIVPSRPGGIAAASVHFGFPLWYFDHEAVDSIATAIFDEWGIQGGRR